MGFPIYQPRPTFQLPNQAQPQPPPQQEIQANKPPLEHMFMQFMSKIQARDAKMDQAIQA